MEIVAIALSIVVPTAIAILVARDGRRTTLATVDRQLKLERRERQRDELKAAAARYASIASQQILVRDHAEYLVTLRAVTEAATTVTFALSPERLAAIGGYVDGSAGWLMDLRVAVRRAEESADAVARKHGEREIGRWAAVTAELCRMIRVESNDADIQALMDAEIPAKHVRHYAEPPAGMTID